VQLSYRGNKAAGWNEDGNGNGQSYVDYGFKRGDSRSNDWYWFGNITIAIYLRASGNTRTYWQTTCPRGKN
jgi:hypothetical protein